MGSTPGAGRNVSVNVGRDLSLDGEPVYGIAVSPWLVRSMVAAVVESVVEAPASKPDQAIASNGRA